MDYKYFVISELCVFGALFLRYLSTGNPGYLIFCLGNIGVLISTSELFNFNSIIYYIALLCITVLQSVILINTYLLQTIYLHNNEQYIVGAFGVIAYIVIIALLFKPNLFKKNSKTHV